MNKDFETHSRSVQSQLDRIKNNANASMLEGNERRGRINRLLHEIQDLEQEAGVRLQLPNRLDPLRPVSNFSEFATALSVIPEERRRELQAEFLDPVVSARPLDEFDIFVIMTLGGMALLADFFLVGLPPETKWVPKNEGGVVPTGWLAERLKSWSVDDNNWLSSLCKVPFDKTFIPESDIPLSPQNHRLLSFGHDPSPLGMVFGLMDIARGGMSGIDGSTGRPFPLLSDLPTDEARLIQAPVLWIGHLASDIATPMGLPPPGGVLTQLLQIPAAGAPGDATIADVCRRMYVQGYDFRHYLTGGIVPALIEIVVHAYHFIRYSYPMSSTRANRNLVSANLAENYVLQSELEGHRAAMLFWAHAMAAAINACKVVVQGFTGNYFSAVRAINLAQWQTFAVRTIQYMAHCFRDKKVEQIVKNRAALNRKWDELLAKSRTASCFILEEAPVLHIVASDQP